MSDMQLMYFFNVLILVTTRLTQSDSMSFYAFNCMEVRQECNIYGEKSERRAVIRLGFSRVPFGS